MKCVNCGAINKRGDRFCNNCGQPLPQPRPATPPAYAPRQHTPGWVWGLLSFVGVGLVLLLVLMLSGNLRIRVNAPASNVEQQPYSQPQQAAQTTVSNEKIGYFCDGSGNATPFVSNEKIIQINLNWAAKTQQQVKDFLYHVQYAVTDNGVAIPSQPYLGNITAGDELGFRAPCGVAIAPLAPGTHIIRTRISFTKQIFDGQDYYGPGSPKETLDGTCTIVVGKSSPSTRQAVSASTDQQEGNKPVIQTGMLCTPQLSRDFCQKAGGNWTTHPGISEEYCLCNQEHPKEECEANNGAWLPIAHYCTYQEIHAPKPPCFPALAKDFCEKASGQWTNNASSGENYCLCNGANAQAECEKYQGVWNDKDKRCSLIQSPQSPVLPDLPVNVSCMPKLTTEHQCISYGKKWIVNEDTGEKYCQCEMNILAETECIQNYGKWFDDTEQCSYGDNCPDLRMEDYYPDIPGFNEACAKRGGFTVENNDDFRFNYCICPNKYTSQPTCPWIIVDPGKNGPALDHNIHLMIINGVPFLDIYINNDNGGFTTSHLKVIIHLKDGAVASTQLGEGMRSWGGAVGVESVNGIDIGAEYPGGPSVGPDRETLPFDESKVASIFVCADNCCIDLDQFKKSACPPNDNFRADFVEWKSGVITYNVTSKQGWDSGVHILPDLKDTQGNDWVQDLSCDRKSDTVMKCSGGPANFKTAGNGSMSFSYGSGGNDCPVTITAKIPTLTIIKPTVKPQTCPICKGAGKCCPAGQTCCSCGCFAVYAAIDCYSYCP